MIGTSSWSQRRLPVYWLPVSFDLCGREPGPLGRSSATDLCCRSGSIGLLERLLHEPVGLLPEVCQSAKVLVLFISLVSRMKESPTIREF